MRKSASLSTYLRSGFHVVIMMIVVIMVVHLRISFMAAKLHFFHKFLVRDEIKIKTRSCQNVLCKKVSDWLLGGHLQTRLLVSVHTLLHISTHFAAGHYMFCQLDRGDSTNNLYIKDASQYHISCITHAAQLSRNPINQSATSSQGPRLYFVLF